MDNCFYMKQPKEPSFPPPHKFSDKYDICDWRYFVDEPTYRRK
jgi:hypothetical protein